MSPQPSEQLLARHWIHSHEEDSGDQLVFRPAEYPFPRARGRNELDLGAGGVLKRAKPGPTDKPEWSDGTWAIEASDVLVLSPASGGPTRYRVTSVDKDRLTLTRS